MTCSGSWRALALFAALPVVGQAVERAELKPVWPADAYAGETRIEDRILAMVNTERRRRRIPEVRLSTVLRNAARQHSTEMVTEDYFAHESPHAAWREPSQRAWLAGYWEAFVAENIAYVTTGRGRMGDEETAEWFMHSDAGWMNSSGHRHNILDPQYTHLGVGVVIRGGKHMATQVFGQHYYEIEDAALEQRDGDWAMIGRATLVGRTNRVHLGLDGSLVGQVDIEQGGSFFFRVPVPRDRRVHKVGLHPGKDARSYWLRYLFYIDTGRPLAEALIPPPAA